MTSPSSPPVFPFGLPSTPRPPRRPRGRAAAFVLGVYPSALHVRWSRARGAFVEALAVDDEPTVFWTGEDGPERVAAWGERVGWRDEWGSIASPSTNGSSGRIVRDEILAPLGIAIEDAWLTDCVDTYFVKDGPSSQQRAIDTRYAPFAKERRLPAATLPPRPAPRELVRIATRDHAARLRAELLESAAPLVITLGNEALAVLRAIANHEGIPAKLDPAPAAYGREGRVQIEDHTARVIPCIHPGQHADVWTRAHTAWKTRIPPAP